MLKVFSVTEVNKYIKDMFLNNPVFLNMYVKGEISNFKLHSSGHAYFCLKDENSILKCVMFKNNFNMLKFTPSNGISVIANGKVSVYECNGEYQLYVDELHSDGYGSLYLAFEQLKQKLQEEGMFDKSQKKPLPYLPTKIGVITSLTGAVVRDIIKVASMRFYNIKINIFPVKVQGLDAAKQIAQAIKLANMYGHLDVIIIARGGGSIEELWAFNEEIVARSIFSSKIPVVSAVGHETDYTISDFVADLRAATPSAAAELVVPEKRILEDNIKIYKMRLNNAISFCLKKEKSRLDFLTQNPVFTRPYEFIYQSRLQIDSHIKIIVKCINNKISDLKHGFGAVCGKLDALSPISILARGYTIAVKLNSGKYIKSAKDAEIGDKIGLITSSGTLQCTVDSKEDG